MCYAQDVESCIDVATDEITLTYEEIEQGVEIYGYFDELGNVYLVKSNDSSAIVPYSTDGVISVNLKKSGNNRYYLVWTLTATSNITYLSGTAYARDSSSLHPTPYFEVSLYAPYSAGFVASGSTETKYIASNTSIRVGWESVLVRTVKNSFSIPNANSIVYT